MQQHNDGRGIGTQLVFRPFSRTLTKGLSHAGSSTGSDAPEGGDQATHDTPAALVSTRTHPAADVIAASPPAVGAVDTAQARTVSPLRVAEFAWAILAAKQRELDRQMRARSDALEREKLEIERARFELERARLESARNSQPELPNDRMWTEKEAATFLVMSTRWLRDSTVPKTTLPGKGNRPTIRYAPEEVRAWEKAHRTHSVIEQANPSPSTKQRRNTR
jgi:hypothetical protein